MAMLNNQMVLDLKPLEMGGLHLQNTHRFALPRDGVGHHHVVHTSRAGRPSDRASHATN
jgi:hypothetical protein